MADVVYGDIEKPPPLPGEGGVKTSGVEKKTRMAKWATVWISVIFSMLLVGFISTGAAMGNTGTDANGNSVGIIFWLLFWQIPLVFVIAFGFTIVVTLLVCRIHVSVLSHLHTQDIRSSRHTNDPAQIEKAVTTAFYNSGTTILLFGIFASIEFVTSVISLGWRASLYFSCTAPTCFVGIYNRALGEFFVYDVFTAILAGIAIGFGFYFWYQVKTGRQQVCGFVHLLSLTRHSMHWHVREAPTEDTRVMGTLVDPLQHPHQHPISCRVRAKRVHVHLL